MRRIAWVLAIGMLFCVGCAEEEAENGAESGATNSSAEEESDASAASEDSGEEAGNAADGEANATEESDTQVSEDATEAVICECSSAADCSGGDLCVPAGDSGICSPFPVQGLCWDDSQCSFGAKCDGVNVCGCGEECTLPHSPGKCTEGSGCCGSDEDCIGNEVCVEDKAVCKPLVGSFCWRDADCGDGESCVGETICQCGNTCLDEDVGGKCFPEGFSCCLSDTDCGNVDEFFCEENTCYEKVSDGECWSSDDCALGEVCAGADPGCSCLGSADCTAVATKGTCTPPLACCETFSDCPDGFACVAGACRDDMELLEVGACWEDKGCFGGEVCVGAVVCSCGSVCDLDEGAGFCQVQEEPVPEGCCKTDEDCPNGVCLEGLCQPMPSMALGECWSDEYCGNGETCVGVIPGCTCESQEFCDAQATPGKCEPATSGDECCLSDVNCPDGRCIEGFCEALPGEGECWDVSDCNAGEECVNVNFGCQCGTPPCDTVSMPGSCKAPSNCCTANEDCPDQMCIQGDCKDVPESGSCWSDTDCEPEQICEGAKPCPCGAPCETDPDAQEFPGTCSVGSGDIP